MSDSQIISAALIGGLGASGAIIAALINKSSKSMKIDDVNNIADLLMERILSLSPEIQDSNVRKKIEDAVDSAKSKQLALYAQYARSQQFWTEAQKWLEKEQSKSLAKRVTKIVRLRYPELPNLKDFEESIDDRISLICFTLSQGRTDLMAKTNLVPRIGSSSEEYKEQYRVAFEAIEEVADKAIKREHLSKAAAEAVKYVAEKIVNRKL